MTPGSYYFACQVMLNPQGFAKCMEVIVACSEESTDRFGSHEKWYCRACTLSMVLIFKMCSPYVTVHTVHACHICMHAGQMYQNFLKNFVCLARVGI